MTDKFYENIHLMTTRKIFKEHHSRMFDILHSHDFHSYDEMLKKIDISRASEYVLISVLRLAFSYRDKIENFKPFLEQTRQELINRGFDAEEELRGLDKEFSNSDIQTREYIENICNPQKR